jgi:alpha-tubulin suppressor-like RCC1 family protein
MKRKKLSWIILISTVLFSISCGLFYGKPMPEQTPPSTEGPIPELPVTSPEQSAAPAGSVPEPHVTAIATGAMHACALFNTGKVKCWGSNSAGQLGDGTYQSRSTPAEVPGLENVTAIAAGGSHTCALLADGAVKCFGDNFYGQLGDGTLDKRWTPTPVSGLKDAVSIAAGDEHTCAITKEKKAKCWGKNLYSRLGSGIADRVLKTPVDVIDLGGEPLSIAPGYEHTCAVIEPGRVQCWGHNADEQVGDGTTIDRKVPTDVTDLKPGVVSVATGFANSCALTEAKSVICWGWNGWQDYSSEMRGIDGLDKNISAVAVGIDHICGLTQEGKVKCTGGNEHGQLGNGTTRSVDAAKTAKGLDHVKAIAVNMYYSCALTDDKSIYCWGQNNSGQLGNGTSTDSSTPVEVIGLSD